MFVIILLIKVNPTYAQNGTYFILGLAPTHSFNRNYEPFDIPKIHLEPSLEVGFTKNKSSCYIKLLSSHGESISRVESRGDLKDSWYSINHKQYHFSNSAIIAGVKRTIFLNRNITISIPFGLSFTRSHYFENRSFWRYPNQPNLKIYPSKDDQDQKHFGLQLNSGLESNINLFNETIFLHSQVSYYFPCFNNHLLWHRGSFNLGIKIQPKLKALKKYLQEYYP